ncbi:MAG: hypothetical protein KDD62_09100, partial [Bdellovibrionales bacterium]|nr:hypothetical protein [Bdellovibrionales bacterium]
HWNQHLIQAQVSVYFSVRFSVYLATLLASAAILEITMKLFRVLTASLLLNVFSSQITWAQFETNLGTLGANGSSYSCVSAVGSKDVKVKVTTSKGKAKLYSKSKAKRQLRKLLGTLKKRSAKFSKLRKSKNKKLEKLLTKTSLLPNPQIPIQINKLRDQIGKLDTQVSITQGDVELLISVISQIDSCSDVPDVGNGTNLLIQENGSSPYYGSSYFILAAVYAFPINTSKSGNQVCANIDGVVSKLSVKASHCFSIQDQKPGEPAGANFSACYGLPTGPYNGFIVLRHGVNYFHNNGSYDQVLGLMKEALLKDVNLYLPNSSGGC